MASLFDSLTEEEIDALLRQLNESEGDNPEPNPFDYSSEADVSPEFDYSTVVDNPEPAVVDYATEADVSPESDYSTLVDSAEPTVADYVPEPDLTSEIDYSTLGDTPIFQVPDVLPPMMEFETIEPTGVQDMVFNVPPSTQVNVPEIEQSFVVPPFGSVDELEALRSAAGVPQTISNVFNVSELTPTLKAVQEVGGGTTTATDASGNVTTLPTFVVQEPKFTGGELGNIFNPNQITGADYIGFNTELSGATPGISPGTGIGAAGGGPTSTVKVGDTNQTVSFDDIVNKEIQAEIERMRNEGVFSSDPEFGTRIEVAANRGLEIYNAAAGPGRSLDLSSSGGAVAGQGGIPLILPIPGIDPSTAAILTAAGLIFSGGKIARLDPNNPAGSVAGAVQGVGQTGQNVINVATGQTTIGEIWDPGSTGAPSGATGGGAAAGTGGQQTTGTGAIGAVGGIFGGGTSGAGAGTGGQQTTIGGAVGVAPGALGGDTTQAPSTTQQPIRQTGTAQQPEMATSTSVPGLFGGGQTIQPAVPQQPQATPIRQTGTAQGPDIATSSSVPGLFGGGQTIEPATPRQGPLTPIRQTGTATGPNIVSQTPSVDLEPDVTSGPPAVTPTPSSTVPTSTTPTTTGTAATPIVINAPTVGYTLPSSGTPAQRNLYTEAGTTLSSLASPMQRFQIGIDASGNAIYGTIPQTGGRPATLSEAIAQGYGGLAGGMREADVQNLFGAIGAATGRTPTAQTGYQAELNRAAAEQTAAANAALRLGNIMDAELLSARAQALRQQANPELFGAGGALPQYTQQAREQAKRDVTALRAAEAGQLTPEQIRNAQQAAREAYAARGQVFSEGAKAQEVLNRQQAIQQQQQIARQNLAQSMGQLGQGVAYQTANIFDPMAATLGAQYGMQSQNVGMNQALYNQAMGLTSGAGGYGFAQQMINPFTGYAQDVYGTNVNALNAAQIAAANRQAALEAAKMGQTGTYAQALGNLIASGGLGQIQSGITGGVQGLLNLLGGKWPTS